MADERTHQPAPRREREWLERWSHLLRLPPAQARTAAYLLAAAALGIALLGLPEALRPSPPAAPSGAGAPGPGVPATAGLPDAGPAESPGYGEAVERELEAMLGLMEGVGGVKVFITWERGPERVVAFDETVEQRQPAPQAGPGQAPAPAERRVQRQLAIVRDSDGRRESPVVLTERAPVVKGVMVVADGARDPRVRLAIQRAVSAALGVAPYRVYVEAKRR
ncbi:MAG TPA: hypothetical protein VIK90_03845 [Limnochordales bacterium]